MTSGDSFSFTLTGPVRATHSRLAPLFGLSIVPVWRSLTFPYGHYEAKLAAGPWVCWRYLGPNFSTIGTYKTSPDGRTMTPVGYKGPWEFAGQWVKDPESCAEITNDTAARHAGAVKALAQFRSLIESGRVTEALASLIDLS